MKTKVTFIGKIVDGNVTFADPTDAQYLKSWDGQQVWVTVTLATGASCETLASQSAPNV